MKTLKIVLALTAIIAISAVTIGLTFAHYTGNPFTTRTNSVQDTFTEDWWTRMEDYMQTRWNGIEDQTWFNDMTQYMEEHYTEVQNQEWFNDMLEYMEDRGYNFGNRNYDDTYFGPRSSSRRGFGCWGW